MDFTPVKVDEFNATGINSAIRSDESEKDDKKIAAAPATMKVFAMHPAELQATQDKSYRTSAATMLKSASASSASATISSAEQPPNPQSDDAETLRSEIELIRNAIGKYLHMRSPVPINVSDSLSKKLELLMAADDLGIFRGNKKWAQTQTNACSEARKLFNDAAEDAAEIYEDTKGKYSQQDKDAAVATIDKALEAHGQAIAELQKLRKSADYVKTFKLDFVQFLEAKQTVRKD
jgi:hypothetical protein